MDELGDEFARESDDAKSGKDKEEEIASSGFEQLFQINNGHGASREKMNKIERLQSQKIQTEISLTARFSR